MREIIDAKVQRWSIPPKKLSLQMGVGVSLSLHPIDVYNFGWMNIVFFLHLLASAICSCVFIYFPCCSPAALHDLFCMSLSTSGLTLAELIKCMQNSGLYFWLSWKSWIFFKHQIRKYLFFMCCLRLSYLHNISFHQSVFCCCNSQNKGKFEN